MKNRMVAFLVFPLLFAALAYGAACGNGVCDSDAGENFCTCPADCGACAGTIPDMACREYGCVDGKCRPVIIRNCCGNAICEGKETYAECPADCLPKSVDIEILKPLQGESFFRGENALIKVKITAEGRNATSADAAASGFFGAIKLRNDGMHEDDAGGDAVFANSVLIDKNAAEGTFPVAVSASFLGVDSNGAVIDFAVDPRLNVDFSLNERYSLGDIIGISGTITRRETPLGIPLALSLKSGNAVIFEAELESDSNGRFSLPYHTSMLDPVGNWAVFLSGNDELGNYADANRVIVVERAKTTAFLRVEFVGEFRDSYERESQLQLIVNVKDEKGGPVSGADTRLLTPLQETIPLHEFKEGQYTGVYDIPYNTPLGKKRFEVHSSKSDGGVSYDGFTGRYITITETTIRTEIMEPREVHYRVGDAMPVKVKAYYPSGKLATAATGRALLGTREIAIPQASVGILETSVALEEGDAGIANLFIEVSDGFGNRGLSETQLEISGVSFTYNLQKNAVLIAAAAGIILLVLAILGVIAGAIVLSRRLDLRKKELQNLEHKLQTDYFEKGSITREEYRSLLDKYEHELGSIDRRLKRGKK